MQIDVRGISKSFGPHPVLQDVSLCVDSGELVALLGPSGCGKTTLLRIIAGLEYPDAGAVLVDGEDVTGRSVRERRFGFVFQHFALFRHMTVFENVAFGLKVKPRRARPPGPEIRRRVNELLRLVRLEAHAGHLPSELSGGQRQRVALARALAVEPRVLLLDEPFGSLDAMVRRELRIWLRRLHDELHLTSLFVTHDQEEALEVADRVAVMDAGRLVQIGTPEDVHMKPVNLFVHNFLGSVNLFHGRIEAGSLHLGSSAIDLPTDAPLPEGPALVYVRPHVMAIALDPGNGPSFRARVVHIHPAGAVVKVHLLSEWGEPLSVEISHERRGLIGLAVGQEVHVQTAAENFFVASESGQEA